MTWRKVKAMKYYQCLCCGGDINKGDEYFLEIERIENSIFPQVSRYDSKCGEWVRQGYSFEEARKRKQEEELSESKSNDNGEVPGS